MRVFIQNEAGSDQKNIHNEKTLAYERTMTVSRAYPYPYGFILHTTSGDGDNLDCFVMTRQRLKTGQIVDCEPIGLLEVMDNGREDHKILAVMNPARDHIDDETKEQLRDFINHVFDHMEEKVVVPGEFLGKNEAVAYLHQCLDDPD